MSEPDFAEVRRWFERALDHPAAQRAAFLESAPLDTTVRREVLLLLQHHDAERGPLEDLAQESLPRVLDDVLGRGLEGARVGPWQLVQLLATGGSGVVFEAKDEDGRRRAALKILHLDSRTAERRFRDEAEVLSRLHHPAIAEVYGSGLANLGGELEAPWLAMELVEGARPADRWWAQEQPSFARRLALFDQIAAGVQHAHECGVIHRDLKPDNVLVDVQGRPKIVDFGLARPQWKDGSRATRTGQVFGTLRWMSPEHLSGRPEQVDARSDVYSLAVLLYEMLLERSPYAGVENGPLAILTAVREAKVLPPRRVDPHFSPDLERVLLAALRAEPDRRTPSVALLREDVQRVARGEPVLALSPSGWSELRAWSRRHRTAARAGLAVFLSLLAGGSAGWIGFSAARRSAVRAEQRADEAEALLDFLSEMLSTGGSSSADWRVREVIDGVAERMTRRFADRPALLATVHRTVGRSYQELGALRLAEQHLRAAYELRRSLPSDRERDEDLRTSALELGVLLLEDGRVAEAAPLVRSCHEGRRRDLGPDDPRTLGAKHWLAVTLDLEGRSDQARVLLGEVLERRRAVLGPVSAETLETARLLVTWNQLAGEPRAAIEIASSVLAAFDAEPAGQPRRGVRIEWREVLAEARTESGALAEASEDWRVVIEEWEQRGDPGRVELARRRRSRVLVAQAEFSEAAAETRRALTSVLIREGQTADTTIDTRLELVRILLGAGDSAAARRELENAEFAVQLADRWPAGRREDLERLRRQLEARSEDGAPPEGG